MDTSITHISFVSRSASVKIWGMTPLERTTKQLNQKHKGGFEIVDAAKLEGFAGQHILLLRDDAIYDASLLAGMMTLKDHLFINDDGVPVGGYVTKDKIDKAVQWLQEDGEALDLPTLTPQQSGNAYRDELRKKADPYAFIANKDNKSDLEWYLFKGSYKGVTDLVTKYVWPVPAYYVTHICAKLKMTPNMVTTIGAILMFAALYWFWQGNYTCGLIAGWIMTFLDTVDGKLARTTLTSSKWGNVFDHGIDLLHPPFWYIAWGMGLAAYGTPIAGGVMSALLIAMFASYVFGRLCEGYFIRRFGFHIHVWRKGDSFFRLICARRNPNLIVMTALLCVGMPDIALWFISLWHVATVLVHLVQIAQAEIARKKGVALSSWLQNG